MVIERSVIDKKAEFIFVVCDWINEITDDNFSIATDHFSATTKKHDEYKQVTNIAEKQSADCILVFKIEENQRDLIKGKIIDDLINNNIVRESEIYFFKK